MCYLVTWFKPVKTSEFNILQTLVFEENEASTELPLILAMNHAEKLLSEGSTEVKVWKLHGAPEIVKTVSWNFGEEK